MEFDSKNYGTELETAFLQQVAFFMQNSQPSLLPFAQTASQKARKMTKQEDAQMETEENSESISTKSQVKSLIAPRCSNCCCYMDLGSSCSIREKSRKVNAILISCKICGSETEETIFITCGEINLNPCNVRSIKQKCRKKSRRPVSVEKQIKNVHRKSSGKVSNNCSQKLKGKQKRKKDKKSIHNLFS